MLGAHASGSPSPSRNADIGSRQNVSLPSAIQSREPIFMLGISASNLMRRRCARLTNEPVGSGIVVAEGSGHNRCGMPELAIPYSDVQTKETCNKDDYDYYADDVENIHCVLRLRYARFQYESAALDSCSPARFGTSAHSRDESQLAPATSASSSSTRAGAVSLGRVAAIWRASVRLR